MGENVYDVIIIGGGPAGLTAAIYSSRKRLKTLMVTADIGGQINLTSEIENYPGFLKISGAELSRLMEEQIKNFDCEIVFRRVVKAEKINGLFEVELDDGKKYKSVALILAFGKVPRSLNIPGEDKFMGRGVSSCAICDAALFRDKAVAVVGGGNSALEAAEILSRFASKVYLVHRQESFRGDEATLERVRSNPKIEFVLNHVAKEIIGEKFVSGFRIENVNTKESRVLDVNGIFVEIGYETKTDWIRNLVKTNEMGEIEINQKGETSVPGVFAAGDVTNGPYKQMVIAAGQGAVAALSAYNYVQKISGGRQSKSDYGHFQK